MDHRLVVPVGFIDVVGVLLGLAVDGDQTLVVAAAHAALVPGRAAKVEHIPHVGGPHPGTLVKHLGQMLVIKSLVLLGIVLTGGLGAVVSNDALAAVLGDSDGDVGVLGVELVQPGAVLLHLAAVPAKIVVIALHIGDFVHGSVGGRHGHVGNGGQAGGVQLLDQLVQGVVVLHQLVGDTADKNLVGDAPEADGGMVVVLNNQLRHLLHAVVVGGGVLAHHADKRNLRPDDEAQLVAGIIEILGVLVMGQANGVDDTGVVVVVVPGEGVALVQPVLVAAHAPQRGQLAVEEEALLGVHGELPHAHHSGHLVIGLVAAQQGGGHRIEIGIVHAPAVGAGDGHRHLSVVRGTHRAGHLVELSVQNGVHDGKVFIGVGDPALQLEPGPAALRAGLGGNLQTGTAEIVQVEMGGGHAD